MFVYISTKAWNICFNYKRLTVNSFYKKWKFDMIIQQLLFLSPPTLSLISLLSFHLSHFEYILHRLHVTEIYLNISEQYMPEQWVQTLIKLLLRTDQGLGFNNLPFCQHCSKTFLDVANECQNLRLERYFAEIVRWSNILSKCGTTH